jgi:Serine dehydrogenase proteinase
VTIQTTPPTSPKTLDVIIYSGQICIGGYEKLSSLLKDNKASDKALLVLGTPGGDPHAGFRIARALNFFYGSFDLLVPRYCKSAGTLIAVGASNLFLADMSELGPLDVQVKKGDEVMGRNSGLEFINAVNHLQQHAMSSFKNALTQLTVKQGLSTKVASDIAAKLTLGLLEPIAAQIDPLKLAEMQRATEIAFEYGERLAESSNNMKPRALGQLVSGYPSHGFVIDRKEAKKLFWNVERPIGLIADLCTALRDQMEPTIDSADPSISIIPINLQDSKNEDATSDPESATGSPEQFVREGLPADVPSTTTDVGPIG